MLLLCCDVLVVQKGRNKATGSPSARDAGQETYGLSGVRFVLLDVGAFL